MKQKFKVTGHGLQVDKVAILPGSELMLSGPAPGHWSRFGTSEQEAPKEMTVATPKAATPKPKKAADK